MSLVKGKGMYATFLNIDTPGVDVFEPYITRGLKRLSVFTFVPSATELPTEDTWYTTASGRQPQGLDTNGASTIESWQGFFKSLDGMGVAIGFVFGGEGATADIGSMLAGLVADPGMMGSFVATLQAFHVSYIEFDIEGSWETPSGFIAHFESFAENLKIHSNGSISIVVGASAPVGEVDGAASNLPSYITPDFIVENNIYFNVYTYYQLEVATVLDDPCPWIPRKTDIDPSRIAFSATCNGSRNVPSNQLSFQVFIQGFPDASFRAQVKESYLGIFAWIWWQRTHDYPDENLARLFDLTV